MQYQWFDHTPSTQGRHDDAREFEARRRFTVEFGPATTRKEIIKSIREAKAAGDMDLYYVLLDELESYE